MNNGIPQIVLGVVKPSPKLIFYFLEKIKPPQQFIHILDNNTGVTRLEVGPQTITLRDHERLILKPEPISDFWITV